MYLNNNLTFSVTFFSFCYYIISFWPTYLAPCWNSVHNVRCIKNRTKYKLSLWLYYGPFGKFLLHIANFSCQKMRYIRRPYNNSLSVSQLAVCNRNDMTETEFTLIQIFTQEIVWIVMTTKFSPRIAVANAKLKVRKYQEIFFLVSKKGWNKKSTSLY